MFSRCLLMAIMATAFNFASAQTTCQAPQNTYTSTPGSRAVSVNWSYYGGGSPTYQVQYRYAGQVGWTGFINSSTSTTLSNLAPRTSYEWRVRTICAAGDTSVFTNPLSFSTVCNTPQYLYNGTIKHESAQISWSFNGNESSAYQVQYRAADAASWISRPVQPLTSGSLSGLTNDTNYQWRVRSICSPGDTSAFSSTASFRTVCDLPTSTYTYDVTYQSARLSWYGYTAGATYEVHWRAVGTADWTSVSGVPNLSVVLNGLANNTSYEWKVRNTCSATALSAFTQPVIFRTQCAQPYSPTASIVNIDAAELRWTNPYGIYTADVRWRAAGAANWMDVPGLNSADYGLSALAPNTTYEWQVRSACSTTEKSAYTESQLFLTKCDVPTGLTSAGIDYSGATLGWSARTAVNLQYRAAGSASWSTVSAVSSPFSLTGLTNNTVYEWRVSAACAPGSGSDYTATQLFTTRCGPPLYPSATINEKNEIVFSWSGSTGAVYELQWRAAGTADWTVVAGLLNWQYALNPPNLNTAYEWRVRRTCSATETSDFTATSTIMTTCQLGYFSPSSYQANGTSVSLSWYVGQAAGTYEIQWRPAGAADWSTVSGLTTSPYLLTGLTAGVPYEWRIRRMCRPGIGSDFSSASSFTLQCNQPNSFQLNAVSTTTASLTWYGNFGVYPPYELNYRPVGQPAWLSLANLTTNAVSLTGLTNNTTYEWQVRASCATGTSPFGATQTFMTQCGGTPTGLVIESVIAGAVKVRWSGQTGPVAYEIQHRENGTANWITKTIPAGEIDQSQTPGLSSKTYTFYNLAPGRTYEWRVRSACENEVSSPFANGPSMTIYCPYDGITSSSAQPDNSRLSVSWNTLSATDTYEVQWRPQGSSTWLSERGLTGSGYTFTNLEPGLTYEYTIQRVCAADLKSSLLGFNQTIRFQPPASLQLTARTGSAVNVNWTYPAATADELTRTAFTVQYRISGTGNWSSMHIPANTAIGQYPALSVPLTGLTNGATYEVRVRAEYSPQVVSDYSYVATYTLNCPLVYSTQTTVGNTSALLSWYANSSGSAFQLQWRQTGNPAWTTVLIPAVAYGLPTEYSLTGLVANTTYEWRIATDCGNGNLSAFTDIRSFMTGCIVTSTSSLYANPGATSASLSWSYQSTFLGSSVVQYRPLNTVTWLDAPAQTSRSLSLTGLAVNTTYEARIRSVCQGGQAWAVGNPVQFRTICQNVTYNNMAFVQAQAARVTWNLDAPVTVQWRAVGATNWNEAPGTMNAYDFTGLTPGTTYQYRFQATCSPGVSSGYSGLYTFTTNSVPVYSLSLQIDSTGMQVARFRIVNPGNEGYRLQWRVVSAAAWITTGPLAGTTYLLQSLTPGTAYEVRLMQTGAGGLPVYGYVTPFNTYCPPLANQNFVSVAAQSALLSWSISKPVPVLLQWRAGGAASWTTTTFPATGTTYSLTGLTPGTTYEWRAAPVCGAGAVAYSPVSTFRTPALCQAPTFLYSYNANPSSAVLSWYAYSAPARFVVRYRIAGTTAWSTRTGVSGSPFVLTGLSNGTTYDWAVAVDCGSGEPMTYSTSNRFTTQCSSLYVGSVQATPTQAQLNWSAGGPDYVVRWRVQGTTSWLTATATTVPFILTGLVSNTYYEWQVRNGCSPEADAAYVTGYTFRTQCNTGSPFGLLAKAVRADAVSLSWFVENSTNSKVDLNTYTVGWRVQGTTGWTTQSGLTSPYTLADLAPNTTYEWQVRTDCSNLFGSPVTFQTICSLPTNHRVTQQTNATAELAWSDALNGAPYELQWRVAGTDVWNTVSEIAGTTYTLTGLTNNSDYEWQVRGLCGAGYQATAAFRVANASQTSVYTVKTGLWSDASVWSCTCVPAATDAVLLRHVVTVPASYTGFAKQIFYEGAGQLKLSAASVLKPKP